MASDRDQLLQLLGEARRAVAGTGCCLTDDSLPPPPQAICSGMTRLHVVLEGCQRQWTCRDGRELHFDLEPGVYMHTVPFGWNVVDWSLPHKVLGVVIYQSFIRYLYVDHNGQYDRHQTHAGPDLYYHTERPLAADGVHLTAALNEVGRGQRRSKRIVHDMSTALMGMLVDELASSSTDTVSATRKLWQHIVDYMHEHAPEDIDRSSVAAHFHIHPNSLSRIFRRYDQMSFQERLVHVRLERSRRLLRDPALAVETVARRSGFANANYYIKVFKKIYGQTPGSLRSGLTVRQMPGTA